MNLDRPKNLEKSIEVRAKNRPIKIAYLVPFEDLSVNHMLLDAVFYESYTRWAGAYTLIVPSISREFLDPAYELWLEFFDPDFVYAYVELEKELIKRIDQLCSPIAIHRHTIRDNKSGALTKRNFIPDWQLYFTPVSSISTIQSPYGWNLPFRRSEIESEPTVITQYHNGIEHRLLSDNFGTAFHIYKVTHAIPGLFRTLCLVPSNLPNHLIANTERCTSIKDLLSAFSSRKAMPIAKFAMAHSEAIPRVDPYKWADNFSLFIGSTLFDRIHFWNARHFTPSYATNPGAFILEIGFFDDVDLVHQLGQYLNQNNFLGQSNCPAKVTIRSYSHSQKELYQIRDKLSKHTYNSVSVSFNELAIPEKEDFERSYYEKSIDKSIFRLTEDTNKLSPKEPPHFAFLSPRHKGIANGQWIVELEIQRHNNLSRFSNVVDNWKVPRRRKIVNAFTNNLGKVTKAHRLALLPTTENFPFNSRSVNKNYFYNLSLPDDDTFFRHLGLDFFRYPHDDLRSMIGKSTYKNLSISDKGQNLRGVISMFYSLSEAYGILTNKFWREILRAGKEGSARYLVFTRDQLYGILPNDRLTREKLQKELRFSNIGEIKDYMIKSLTDTLEHLIRSNIFYQVHQWRCRYCGQTNSRSFDSMKIINSCEICRREYLAPIDLEWKYQLNDFVYRSLTKQNGLTVLWALGFLQNRIARDSFWYLPEVDLYEKYDDQTKKNEIDILCVVDGKFYAAEVKRSASLFINKTGEIDNFVKEINMIQPDIAMLAFERYCDLEKDVEATKTSFSKVSAEIKRRIDPCIELKVIVAHDVQDFNEYTADLGYFGKRIYKFY
jgi:hypothetical protein